MFEKCDIRDWSKLRVCAGKITFRIYQQDGAMVEMNVPVNFLTNKGPDHG